MTRLTIDISGEDKQKIKTLAALHGKTLKDYVLERVLPPDETADIGALLLQSVTENQYSDWTPEKMQAIRRKLRG